MNELPLVQQSEDVYVNFIAKYDAIHIGWFRYFNDIAKIPPRYLFIHENRMVLFIDKRGYTDACYRWNQFRRVHKYRFELHVRLIPFSQNLAELIRNWYHHIKELEVHIRSNEHRIHIELHGPPHLRPFLIGKHGAEIEYLASMLNSTIFGGYNFTISIR